MQGKRPKSKSRLISYYVAYPSIVKAVNRVFSDSRYYRIYLRCPSRKRLLMVADRPPLGTYSPSGVTYLPERFCDAVTGTEHPFRGPRETWGAAWQRTSQRVEWWRRASLPPRVNKALDIGLSRIVSVIGPPIALVAGKKFAKKVEVNRRLVICKACEHYTDGTCKLCGCSIKFKTRLDSDNPDLRCPVRKW